MTIYSLDCTPFLIWCQSVVPRLVLTIAFWPAYRFFRRQVRWSGMPNTLRIFHSLLWSTVKCFSFVNEGEVHVYLKFSCFFYDPMNVGTLTSGSSAFSKSSLNICMVDECNCLMVWTFCSTALLRNWDENWPLPVLWLWMGLPDLLTYWVQHFERIIF